MSEDKPAQETKALRTTDAATMRALAHPLRVEILSLLDTQGEFTASQVAGRLGQTVANASFHLRTLEKHGYVERSEQRGREKPWRAAHHSRDHTPDPNDPESIEQATRLAALYIQKETARLLNTFERFDSNDADPDWILASTVTNGDFWATKEEMKELVQDLIKITDRFKGRGLDPSKRPPGARKGYFFGTINPDPDTQPWNPDAEHPEDSE